MFQKGSVHLYLMGFAFVIITIISIIYLFNQGIITNSLNSTKPTTAAPAVTQSTQANNTQPSEPEVSLSSQQKIESEYQNPFTETSTDYTNPFDSLE